MLKKYLIVFLVSMVPLIELRGAIPISNESIQDSAVDLVGIVARHANEQKLNTTNYEIAASLKTFTAKTVAGVDDIKTILNVLMQIGINARLFSGFFGKSIDFIRNIKIIQTGL